MGGAPILENGPLFHLSALAMAARLMRRILVDVARARRYQKRGGNPLRVSLGERFVTSEKSQDLVALDEALEALAKLHERKSRVV